jgi:hypothetical protein
VTVSGTATLAIEAAAVSVTPGPKVPPVAPPLAGAGGNNNGDDGGGVKTTFADPADDGDGEDAAKHWLAAGIAGWIPASIKEQMRGQNYRDWSHFREQFGDIA